MRNKNRKEYIPQSAIEDMLSKLIPPRIKESQNVYWICI